MDYSKTNLNDLFLIYTNENNNMDQLAADRNKALVIMEVDRRRNQLFDRLELADTAKDADRVYQWFLNGEPEEE